ncbi:hypothetical protein V8G54_001135 [Vigna mungo]|uniref:Uncharacterized protein n=1 Tax=Vigna mungo TaxID=3915 RepID=A0AAQ3SB78_VIGMU
MPEDVLRIHFGLNPYQPFEVLLVISIAPRTCLFIACAVLGVFSQIKVPVIHICFPWEARNIRTHVFVKLPNPIYVLCRILVSLLPQSQVLNFIQCSVSVRKWGVRF